MFSLPPVFLVLCLVSLVWCLCLLCFYCVSLPFPHFPFVHIYYVRLPLFFVSICVSFMFHVSGSMFLLQVLVMVSLFDMFFSLAFPSCCQFPVYFVVLCQANNKRSLSLTYTFTPSCVCLGPHSHHEVIWEKWHISQLIRKLHDCIRNMLALFSREDKQEISQSAC